jgi:hypothetical protein
LASVGYGFRYGYFEDAQVSSQFVHEFVDAASRCNYLQMGHINALVDMVSLAGAGMVGSVYALPSGTENVPKALLKAAQVDLRLSSPVGGVLRDGGGGGGFKLVLKGNDIETVKDMGSFDAVVVAVPLPVAHLQLPTHRELNLPKYQTVYVTFVEGALAKSYFKTLHNLPGQILTMRGSELFHSLSKEGVSDRDNDVFKIFSKTELKQEDLDQLFEV